MKIKFFLAVILVFGGHSIVFAQPQTVLTTEEIRTAMTTVYSVFNRYVSTSKLQQQGVSGISEQQELAFLELFQPNAMVWDDLTPFDFPDKTEKNSKKTVENLTADYKKYFPGGLIVRILKSNINFENLPERNVRIVIERNISGKYPGKYFITNEGAILEIVIKLSDDFSSAKIAEIKKIVG